MGMSKKDYEKIAKAIRGVQISMENSYAKGSLQREAGINTLHQLTTIIKDILAEDNPRFNEDIFIKKALGKG